ncbi:hypothetical protein FOCC_FOCC001857 [Frankliniella occidentalis]|nr:hypothetical protein FOCC_FOCC001857 [Frankliniella occidentalis]
MYILGEKQQKSLENLKRSCSCFDFYSCFQMRTVNMGLCLPASCGARDISRLIDLSVETANAVDPRAAKARSFKVTSVRTPSTEYLFWEDSTFWVLVGASFIVAVLIGAGTAYDYLLEHRKRTALRHSGYDNYSFGLGAPRLVGMRGKGDFGVRLDVTVPDKAAAAAVATIPAPAPGHPVGHPAGHPTGPATESSIAGHERLHRQRCLERGLLRLARALQRQLRHRLGEKFLCQLISPCDTDSKKPLSRSVSQLWSTKSSKSTFQLDTPYVSNATP